MSTLNLNFSICVSDCNTITFNETTGQYSSLNSSGWNSPNPELYQATSAELTILTPNNSSYTFDLYSTGDFPTVNSTTNYDVIYSDLGFSNNLADGEYTFTYAVVINTGGELPELTTFTRTKKLYIVCNLECCINKLLLNIEDVNCDCNKEARSKYLEAFALLQAFKHANACGRLGTASELFNELTKICSNVDCKTCQ